MSGPEMEPSEEIPTDLAKFGIGPLKLYAEGRWMAYEYPRDKDNPRLYKVVMIGERQYVTVNFDRGEVIVISTKEEHDNPGDALIAAELYSDAHHSTEPHSSGYMDECYKLVEKIN